MAAALPFDPAIRPTVMPQAPTPTGDIRVRAVLEAISGTPVPEVAATYGFEDVMLHRWLESFLRAGAAQITNTPQAQLAEQRDRFLAAFAHELRTPLSVARGWAGMLADGDLGPELTQTTARKLEAALGDVAERMSDAERLSAVALGRLRVHRRHCTLHDIIASAGVPTDDLKSDLTSRTFSTDPDLAARALHDLWQAAGLPPTPRRRRLEVRLTRLWLELRITRMADPIEPRTLIALFEPFDTNDDDTGVSLGLYLARALAVALGGTIGLEQDEFAGHFLLRLPLAPRPRDPRPISHTTKNGTP
ncbi:Signal transduction histidine kinase [Nocardioides scoriae]|uniref:histidine kinase n=1 Tax=Nocardioides scoriae TaxID=642780 RepID=A0A1H1LLT8_9ACTN|nr:HAMP domain-containing sensor histidine kinase [Nocardioides scoriae]SDR74829.1 Signal transduction histidine kinase [Nocardioides scoriae]